ncbi:MAG: FKBP-type peptidyl-prolyl cis-trans isomerase [Pseudomonadota bacterium]|nr:FKBP-type peptidyl-prolyl cis-trans isomerase [Pseudomonadota bacterium]
MRTGIIGLTVLALAGSALAAPAKVPVKAGLAADTPLAKEKAFFAKTDKEPGVTVMPGLAWKVLKSGPADGAHPGRSDTVTVHYVGKLADGTQFDASGGDGTGEASFKVSGVIAGFAAALKLMRPGDQWRVYIPAYLAYGDQVKPTIPAGSTLVFDIELLSIAPPAA